MSPTHRDLGVLDVAYVRIRCESAAVRGVTYAYASGYS
jgi:hypothetical protein